MSVDTTFLPKTSGLVFGDRLAARSDKGRVFLMASQTPAPDPLTVVSDPVLSGNPYIGSVVTVSNPVVTGGIEPYSYDYMWLDTKNIERSDINSTTLLEFDKGKNVSCYVTIVSADGQTVYATSNSIGPVTYAPTDVTITQALPATYDVSPFVRHSLEVQAIGLFDVSYIWQFIKADNSGWVNATPENLVTEFPAAETLFFEVNTDAEPQASVFMFNLVTGPGPSQFRCLVRDTDPDGNFDQKITTTTLNYV